MYLLQILAINRIERISHFMRHSSIDQSQQFFLSIGLIEQDLVRNVQDLEHLILLDTFPSIKFLLLYLIILLLGLLIIISDFDGKYLLPQDICIHFENLIKAELLPNVFFPALHAFHGLVGRVLVLKLPEYFSFENLRLKTSILLLNIVNDESALMVAEADLVFIFCYYGLF